MTAIDWTLVLLLVIGTIGASITYWRTHRHR